MRVCLICKVPKPIEDFYYVSVWYTLKNGERKLFRKKRDVCSKCQNKHEYKLKKMKQFESILTPSRG